MADDGTAEIVVPLDILKRDPESVPLEDALLLPYVEEEANNLTENALAAIPDPYGIQGRLLTTGHASLARTFLHKASKRFAAPEDSDGDSDVEYDEPDLTLPPDSVASTADCVLTLDSDKHLSPVAELQMDNFQWAPLLAHMQLRKLSRIRTGFSRTRNRIPLLIMLLLVCALFIALFYVATKYSDEAGFTISRDFDYELWAWILVGLVLAPGLILMAVAAPQPIELAWFFVASGFIFVLIGYLIYTVEVWEATEPGDVCVGADTSGCADYIYQRTEAFLISLVVLGSLSAFLALCSIGTYLLRCFIYPSLLQHHRLSPSFVRYFLSVQPVPCGLPGSFSCKYRLPFLLSFRQTKHVFRFRGGVNEQGFAEGFGKVSDSAPSGELLEGWFEDGLPAAPFSSAEKGRFNAWESMRVGIVGATGVDGFKSSGTWRDPAGMSLGVAIAECSVAGRFFRNMPAASVAVKRAIPEDPLKHMKNVILPALCAGIPGSPADLHGREAIVYVHGLRQSLASSAKKLTQLISLASLPAHKYSLWCFDWPGGSPWSFRRTREESGSAQTEAELVQFLRVLIDSGCPRVHVIGHSMGCRVVTNLGRNGGQGFSSLFRKVGEPEEANKAELATVILFNPEILVNDFILNRFAGTRKYCSAVTIYADRSDNALRLAELIGPEQTLGRNPHMVLTRDSQGRARYLDIDIIDNTSLEQNINAVRHSYFALNTMLVNDLRDQIHLGLGRAKDRSRLRRRVGNVWGFLVAPSAAK